MNNSAVRSHNNHRRENREPARSHKCAMVEFSPAAGNLRSMARRSPMP
jgi:hypothetical protein